MPQPESTLLPRQRHQIQSGLRRWYAQHARELPWRSTRDPYAIWVSEVMLQQTQVATVIRYFERFLKRFPTVEPLADATLDQVLQVWQGLGYYRRARNLHRAARVIVDRYGGAIPSDSKLLVKLPGVGRYISGAIRSFAFDLPAPVLEANTARVLCRLFAIRGRPGEGTVRRRLWELSEWLLPGRAPGLHNQALMELGALVCVPGKPRCGRCPLARYCMAKSFGIADQLPQSVRRAQPVELDHVSILVQRRGRILIVQQPLDQWWGGLWELPRTTVTAGTDPKRSLEQYVRACLGLSIQVGCQLAAVRHGVTHHRITLTCYEARCVRGRTRSLGYKDFRWEPADRLAGYPISSPQRKLLAKIFQL